MESVLVALLWVSVSFIVVALFLTLAVGLQRVQHAVQLGFDLLDLIKLLVTLRVKSFAVRKRDW